MVERKTLISVLLIVALVSVASVSYTAYGIGPPLAAYSTGLYIDYDTWSGFQKFIQVNELGDREFELRRGTMGTFNLTLKTESKWTVYNTIWLESGEQNTLPYGITYSIEPNMPILEPNSSIVITMWIAAAADMDLESHNLIIKYAYITNDDPYEYGIGFPLTIVEGIAPATITTTSTITSITTSISTETTESTIFYWAVVASIIAIILPAILILRKRT